MCAVVGVCSIAVLIAKSVHQTPEFFSLALKDRNLKLDRIGLLFPFTFIYKQNVSVLSLIFDIAYYYLLPET